MAGKWVIRVHAQRGIFFAFRRLGRNCVTNFVPRGADRTCSLRDV